MGEAIFEEVIKDEVICTACEAMQRAKSAAEDTEPPSKKKRASSATSQLGPWPLTSTSLAFHDERHGGYRGLCAPEASSVGASVGAEPERGTSGWLKRSLLPPYGFTCAITAGDGMP